MNFKLNTMLKKRPQTSLRLFAATGLLLAAAGFVQAALPPFVPVADAGNASDPATGFGAVAYAYRIGVDEVTRAEYAAFLNAVAASDPHGLYSPYMGITRSGSPGGYTYAAVDGGRSVAWVSWYDALRFANWLHNGQPSGAQGAASTEGGAYTFSGETSVGGRNPDAAVFLPTENEWYKAAYYQGGTERWYWGYPTRSDTPPLASAPNSADDNAANYDLAVGEATTAGTYPLSQSYYGTRDQAGNLWEWNESAVGSDRGLRGGSYDDYALLLHTSYRDSQDPSDENEFVGFRVAAAQAVNRPPVAVAESYALDEATILSVGAPGVLANDSDADADPLTVALEATAAHGALTLYVNGAFTYEPAAGFAGEDSFTYRPSDGKVFGNAVAVAFTVRPVYYALSVSGGSGGGSYRAGTVVTVQAAAAAAGMAFDRWTGDTAYVENAAAASTTVTMPRGAASLTATYKAILYTLTVGSGSGDGSYQAGTVVAIQADAAPAGMVFDRWTGDTALLASVTAAATTLTMPGSAASVTATYKSAAGTFDMTYAVWVSSTRYLTVRGIGPAGKTVVFNNAASGSKIGSVVVRSDNTWEFRKKLYAWSLPGMIRATCSGVTDEMPVTRR